MRDVDQIIEATRKICPDVDIQQLTVVHPGNDDDGIWSFSQPCSEFEVQIESGNGMCPFLVETYENANRYYGQSVDETVEILKKLLHLTPAE